MSVLIPSQDRNEYRCFGGVNRFAGQYPRHAKVSEAKLAAGCVLRPAAFFASVASIARLTCRSIAINAVPFLSINDPFRLRSLMMREARGWFHGLQKAFAGGANG